MVTMRNTLRDKRANENADRSFHVSIAVATANDMLARIDDAKLTRSMSRKGCSPDNAACEGFFGRLTTELFYPWQWRATTVEQFIQILDSYIRWYNEKRIKVSLGSLRLLEYRVSLGIAA